MVLRNGKRSNKSCTDTFVAICRTQGRTHTYLSNFTFTYTSSMSKKREERIQLPLTEKTFETN